MCDLGGRCVPSGKVVGNETIGNFEAHAFRKFDSAGKKFAIDRGLKERKAREFGRRPGNTMNLLMIGVSVAAIAIVSNEEFGVFFGQHGGKRSSGFADGCSTEGALRSEAIGARCMARVEIVEEHHPVGTDCRR